MLKIKHMGQVGGVYHQVVESGKWVLASRTGGLELLAREDDKLVPISHLPLCSVPFIQRRSDNTFVLRFRTKELPIRLSPDGQISCGHVGSVAPASISHVRSLFSREISIRGFNYRLTEKGEGIEVLDSCGISRIVPLEGYSAPSSIYRAQSGCEIMIPDVGAIRLLRSHEWDVKPVGGHFVFGWPKDASVADDNVFCADVLGVKWYRRIAEYPGLEYVASLSRTHFRVAKVVSCDEKLILCDEAHGLHFVEAENDHLIVKGGLLLPGGAWGCHVADRRLYIANGDFGWSATTFEWERWKHGAVVRHPLKHRVNGITFWKEANVVVLLTKAGVLFVHEGDVRNNSDVCEQVCTDAWAAECVFEFLVVAAATHGLLVFSKRRGGTFSVVSRMKTVEARDLQFDGKHLWVADGRGGLTCCSIDQGSGKMELVGIYPISGFSRGLAVQQELICVGAGDGGLVVLSKGEQGDW